ncbi:hypothetical protein [Yinghuangia seranimata]|uniref:hypothetical protein n=1 Tax=Yinghuangia seranimata TaxID=408067 RepID=UPI00248D0DFA|nr:hypothetical protein [Yinghuangia seranimata]MDI2132286.1 hypothetical protein [Yinghuangia seranimata]
MARRIARAGFVLGLTSASVAASVIGLAPTAYAGTTVPMQVHCELPLEQPAIEGEQLVTLDGPAEAVRPGAKVKIRVTLGPNAGTSPIPFPGTLLTPSIDLTMSGGASGTVRLQGPQMRVDIPGAPHQIVVPPYEGELSIPIEARGDISLTPGKMVTNTQTFGDQITTCFPTSPVGVSTVIRITAQDAPPNPAQGPAGTSTSQSPQAAVPVAPQSPPAFGTATGTGAPEPERSSATLKASGAASSSDGGGMSGAALFGIGAGVLVLAMAVVTMLLSWRRHTEDD